MPDGAISYAGTTTQNQTSAATLIDADGAPSDTAVSYRWPKSADGSNVDRYSRAAARSLTLQQAQVGAKNPCRRLVSRRCRQPGDCDWKKHRLPSRTPISFTFATADDATPVTVSGVLAPS